MLFIIISALIISLLVYDYNEEKNVDDIPEEYRNLPEMNSFAKIKRMRRIRKCNVHRI
ncbi:hypothetical protein [Inconstantimicrobium mannanitabidum]|uniref:Uncharacterized protein n=1 Tax=Inconstantimicrobium mannanitabidum TaxID=1604901 RepID=A0ACB5RA91_9CLOT|nr:hypothetical protein [Clostridium sp. TW13]GKX65960.1 hypothetical protein rsdtw13_12180 [Clostridium sp. TW13]